jgi:DNA-binding beta-propeller fold protein YncE
VYAETPDRIWIAQRGELPLPPGAKPWTPYAQLQPPRQATGNGDGLSATCEPTEKRGWERRYHHSIIILDRNGNKVDWWQNRDVDFEGKCGRGPHKIKMNPYDPEKAVWIIDDQLHTIVKYSNDGKQVLLTLGTKGQRGRDAGKLFDRPTDIDWLPDGTFFISDGYGGTRVAKFDKDGNFLMDWGSAPKDRANPQPNEWNTVHSLAISKDRRITVVDRGHRRIQVFDENGKFLYLFNTGTNSQPYHHIISADDQTLWQVDGGTNRVVGYDLDGHYKYGWGGPGGQPGRLNGGHQLTVDQEGNLYIAEVFGGRVQKFAPKPNADKTKMVGIELKPGAATATN